MKKKQKATWIERQEQEFINKWIKQKQEAFDLVLKLCCGGRYNRKRGE